MGEKIVVPICDDVNLLWTKVNQECSHILKKLALLNPMSTAAGIYVTARATHITAFILRV